MSIKSSASLSKSTSNHSIHAAEDAARLAAAAAVAIGDNDNLTATATAASMMNIPPKDKESYDNNSAAASALTRKNSHKKLNSLNVNSSGGGSNSTPATTTITTKGSFSKLYKSEQFERSNSYEESITNLHPKSRLISQFSQDPSQTGSAKKRARTMYAPVQMNTYGPKATLKKVTEDSLLLIQDPLSQQLLWTKPPLKVLVIKKICATLTDPFVQIIKHLIFNHNMIVYVEETEFDQELFKTDDQIRNLLSQNNSINNSTTTTTNNQQQQNNNTNSGSKKQQECKPQLRKFITQSSLTRFNQQQQQFFKLGPPVSNSTNNNSCENITNKIDLIICLGGDGTILHASTLFQKSCPPVLSLNMGSLGFLCPFDFENFKEYVDGVIKGNVPLLVRNRLSCRLEKISDSLSASTSYQQQQQQLLPSSSSLNESYVGTIAANDESSATTITTVLDSTAADSQTQTSTNEWLSLNEVVVDRGPSPFLSNLDLYINDYLVTTVQGDGLIISSPTGSTAYAMAAGASMCHPSVPAIIIVPICPHSLSFRPVVVPAGVELRIALSSDARHTASYSIDGRNSGELKKGYQLRITTSEFPLPSICRSDQMNDWFEGLGMCLHWNQRQKQLPLNSCYLSAANVVPVNSTSAFSSKSSSTSSLNQAATGPTMAASSNPSPPSSSSSTSNHNQSEDTVAATAKATAKVSFQLGDS